MNQKIVIDRLYQLANLPEQDCASTAGKCFLNLIDEEKLDSFKKEDDGPFRSYCYKYSVLFFRSIGIKEEDIKKLVGDISVNRSGCYICPASDIDKKSRIKLFNKFFNNGLEIE